MIIYFILSLLFLSSNKPFGLYIYVWSYRLAHILNGLPRVWLKSPKKVWVGILRPMTYIEILSWWMVICFFNFAFILLNILPKNNPVIYFRLSKVIIKVKKKQKNLKVGRIFIFYIWVMINELWLRVRICQIFYQGSWPSLVMVWPI